MAREDLGELQNVLSQLPAHCCAFFSSFAEEKNKEKKGGENSTDTASGTPWVRIGDQSSNLNWFMCASLSAPQPSLSSFSFTRHHGIQSLSQGRFSLEQEGWVYSLAGFCVLPPPPPPPRRGRRTSWSGYDTQAQSREPEWPV